MSTRTRPRYPSYKRPEGSCNLCGKQTGKEVPITRDGHARLVRVWDCKECNWHNVEYVKTGT